MADNQMENAYLRLFFIIIIVVGLIQVIAGFICDNGLFSIAGSIILCVALFSANFSANNTIRVVLSNKKGGDQGNDTADKLNIKDGVNQDTESTQGSTKKEIVWCNIKN